MPPLAAPEPMKMPCGLWYHGGTPRAGLTPKWNLCFEPACQPGEGHRANPNLSPAGAARGAGGARRADWLLPAMPPPREAPWGDPQVDPAGEVRLRDVTSARPRSPGPMCLSDRSAV